MSTPKSNLTVALKEAARTINQLVKLNEDARRLLCIAIAGAQELVREAGLSWREWAAENLRKPDGTKWSQWTLYSMASYGRDPQKLEHARRSTNANGQRARRALRLIQHEVAVTEVNSRTIEEEKELQWLLTAWKRCSPRTKRKFLEIINKEVAS